MVQVPLIVMKHYFFFSGLLYRHCPNPPVPHCDQIKIPLCFPCFPSFSEEEGAGISGTISGSCFGEIIRPSFGA